MDTAVLTARDYFHYYFAGLAWLGLIVALVWLGDPGQIARTTPKALEDSVGSVSFAALAISVPYLIGFMVGWVGDTLTMHVFFRTFGDRKRWTIYKGIDDCTIRLAAHRLRQLIATNASESLPACGTTNGPLDNGVSPRPRTSCQDRVLLHRQFDLLRTYVRNSGLATVELGDRNRLLANLAESLLVPVPVALFILAIASIRNLAHPGIGVLFVFLAVVSAMFIGREYRYSREWETRHIISTLAATSSSAPRARDA
jgi:hypothetical protein